MLFLPTWHYKALFLTCFLASSCSQLVLCWDLKCDGKTSAVSPLKEFTERMREKRKGKRGERRYWIGNHGEWYGWNNKEAANMPKSGPYWENDAGIEICRE